MNQLEKAQRQLEQVRARVRRIKARTRSEQRKKDTRRKIILGGLVLAEARRDPLSAAKLAQRIQALPPRERAAFDGWSLDERSGHEPDVD